MKGSIITFVIVLFGSSLINDQHLPSSEIKAAIADIIGKGFCDAIKKSDGLYSEMKIVDKPHKIRVMTEIDEHRRNPDNTVVEFPWAANQ